MLSIADMTSQVKYKQLAGKWQTCNLSNSFELSDTIIFHQDPNYDVINNSCCEQIQYTINRKKLKIYKEDTCNEPSRGSVIMANEKVKLKKSDYGQLLEVYRNDLLIDKFRIVNLSQQKIETYENKKLTLIRHDYIHEQKLYNYILDLTKKISKKPIDKRSDSKKQKNVEKKYESPELELPLILVNGIPYRDLEIIKHLLLVECTNIKYISKEKAMDSFNGDVRNGIVLITASRRSFKEAKMKYDR